MKYLNQPRIDHPLTGLPERMTRDRITKDLGHGNTCTASPDKKNWTVGEERAGLGSAG